MFHTAAYYEVLDGAAVLHEIAAVNDQPLTISGDNIRVPKSMSNIIGEACLSAADAALTSARLNSPSLRSFSYPEIRPLINAVVFGSPPEGILHPKSPIPLQGDEDLRFEINSDDATTAAEYGLVWFSDGQHGEVNGDIHPVRCTAGITLSAGVWVNGGLTFTQTLPVGRYQIVGMRAEGSNLVAARLVFVDQMARPGVPAVNDVADQDHDLTRYGRMGVFGAFDHTNPPTLDALGVTDTSQVIILDLMKVG